LDATETTEEWQGEEEFSLQAKFWVIQFRMLILLPKTGWHKSPNPEEKMAK
jgi:hypothetical protein